MKTLLVTGISGFLGWHIARHPQSNWKLLGTFHRNPKEYPQVDLHSLDLTDESRTKALLADLSPTAILHLAACAQPNFCEQHPEVAHAVNVEASIRLASLAAQRQIPFIFTSTDLVFDGRQAPYRETDPLEPVNVYGRQKAEAERGVLAIYPEATIARMPLMFSRQRAVASFLTNWLAALERGENVYAFTDEIRTALSGKKAAQGLFQLLDHGLKGIWHLGGREPLSRFDFICQEARAAGLSTDLILPSLQKEVQMPAARPADVSLDSRKAREAFGWAG
ncbi:MAG: SDR family oxidoreductase [Bacteroidota bacterium]